MSNFYVHQRTQYFMWIWSGAISCFITAVVKEGHQDVIRKHLQFGINAIVIGFVIVVNLFTCDTSEWKRNVNVHLKQMK